MAKFIVVRGRDAWVIEEAVVEAASAQEAEEKVSWKSEARQLNWIETGDVRVFDDTEIMEGEARPTEEPLERAEAQKIARREALRKCEEILRDYLVSFLTDTDDPDGLVEGRVEGFEHVDPEIDDLRSEIQELEMNS